MDTDTSREPRKRKTPWEILGVERGTPWEDIRATFLKKARRLHPDKGGDREQFQELRTAYESLRDVMDGEPDAGSNEEVWEEIEKWVDWAGRWGKRLFGDETKTRKSSPEVLRIRVPWKLLEDRTQSVKVEYDGWPVKVPLGGTEIAGAVGLRVRLVPQAEYKRVDGSGNEIICKINDDPWRTDVYWLYDAPSDATGFRVCGGEWKTEPGEYGRGVFWRHSDSHLPIKTNG